MLFPSATWSANDDAASATAYGMHFRATASGLGNAILWFGRVDPDHSSHGIEQGFRADAQTLAADATVDADDLTPAALTSLTAVLC